MARRDRRVHYTLDAEGVDSLPKQELVAILRAADALIGRGGRTLLTRVLKGSHEKSVLEHQLDKNPSFGFYSHLSLEKIAKRVDWVLLQGYLRIEYDHRLPLLVFSDKGWAIEKETLSDEWLGRFDQMLDAGLETFDILFLKDRNREVVMRLLDKVAATGDSKYIPLLEAWRAIDYKKVRDRINGVIKNLRGGRVSGPVVRTATRSSLRRNHETMSEMDRRQLLAAETFSYSYDNYADHLDIRNYRFEKGMPEAVDTLEEAERENWDDARLATALELEEDKVESFRQAYRRAKEVVDAPTPAESFRRGVRHSIQRAVADGQLSEGDVEDLVIQICYRAADLGYLLRISDEPLWKYSEELRHEGQTREVGSGASM